MKKVTSSHAPKVVGPYSQAIDTGNFVFISGQIHVSPSGKLVEGTIEKKTKQVMANLKAVLNAAGLDFSNVTKTEIYLADMGNYSKVNEIYASYFSDPYPARVTVGVKKLPLNADVEISVVAYRSGYSTSENL